MSLWRLLYDHCLGYLLHGRVLFLDSILDEEDGDVEVGPVTFFDVKFSCICRSQCQLQSSFIVFVNLYARVSVTESPDVDFKYFIFHDSMTSL